LDCKIHGVDARPDAQKKGCEHRYARKDLVAAANRTVFSPVLDKGAHIGVLDKPCVDARRGARKPIGRDQQKRRCGQERDKYACDTQDKTEAADKKPDYSHSLWSHRTARFEPWNRDVSVVLVHHGLPKMVQTVTKSVNFHP
jgi:hypothetical protein